MIPLDTRGAFSAVVAHERLEAADRVGADQRGSAALPARILAN
jgi:hypothetical protein